MHVDMLSQLVADRKAELKNSASPRRALPRADETMSKREWRALLRMLQLAR
jgi:hypothetical protein